jgi:hypothetical protein
LSLISQRLDNYYQIQTKCYSVSTVNSSLQIRGTKHRHTSPCRSFCGLICTLTSDDTYMLEVTLHRVYLTRCLRQPRLQPFLSSRVFTHSPAAARVFMHASTTRLHQMYELETRVLTDTPLLLDFCFHSLAPTKNGIFEMFS